MFHSGRMMPAAVFYNGNNKILAVDASTIGPRNLAQKLSIQTVKAQSSAIAQRAPAKPKPVASSANEEKAPSVESHKPAPSAIAPFPYPMSTTLDIPRDTKICKDESCAAPAEIDLKEEAKQSEEKLADTRQVQPTEKKAEVTKPEPSSEEVEVAKEMTTQEILDSLNLSEGDLEVLEIYKRADRNRIDENGQYDPRGELDFENFITPAVYAQYNQIMARVEEKRLSQNTLLPPAGAVSRPFELASASEALKKALTKSGEALSEIRTSLSPVLGDKQELKTASQTTAPSVNEPGKAQKDEQRVEAKRAE